MDASHEFAHLRLNRSSGGDSSNGLGSGPPWTRDITTPRASENVVDVPNAAKQSAAVVCIAECPTQQQKTARMSYWSPEGYRERA